MFITRKYYIYVIHVYIVTYRSGALTQSSTRVSAISNQIVTAR